MPVISMEENLRLLAAQGLTSPFAPVGQIPGTPFASLDWPGLPAGYVAPSVPSRGVTLPIAGVGVGAGVGAAGAIATTAAALGLPAAVGIGAAAIYGMLTGGGNGNGVAVGGVPLGGPGLKEPPALLVAKEWHIRFDSKDGDFKVQFYRLLDGRVMSYNQRTRGWKIWKPSKPLVISRNPRIKDLIRADKFTDRLVAQLGKRVKFKTVKKRIAVG